MLCGWMVYCMCVWIFFFVCFVFFFKQKTAYEMRISDWIQTCALPIWFVAICVVPLLLVRPHPTDTTPPPAPARAIRRGDLALTWGARLLVQLAGNVLFTYLLFYFESVAPGEEPAVLAPRVGQMTTIAFRSEEHTSELQSLMRISYAVFCLKKTKMKVSTK